jgi:hypothetical protein
MAFQSFPPIVGDFQLLINNKKKVALINPIILFAIGATYKVLMHMTLLEQFYAMCIVFKGVLILITFKFILNVCFHSPAKSEC